MTVIGFVAVRVAVNWTCRRVESIYRSGDAADGAAAAGGGDDDTSTVVGSVALVTADVDRGLSFNNRWTPVVHRYVICGLPAGHELWDSHAVFVTRDATGGWTVRSRGRQVDINGTLAALGGDSSWSGFVMSLDAALEVAVQRARTVTTHGMTTDDILSGRDHRPR